MIKPMLCKLQDSAFNSPDYIWEPKLDGARIIAVVKDGKARLFARSGAEKTSLFPELEIVTKCDAVLDGEVVSGQFNDIQHRVNRINGMERVAREFPARYSVFDILEILGTSVRGLGLTRRKEVLQSILTNTENVSLTPFTEDGKGLFDLIKGQQGEGVVGKTKEGLYHEGKRMWLKVKTWQQDTFMAVGYTDGTGWRSSSFGALVLASASGAYVGSVGTGFTEQDLKDLMKLFSAVQCPWSREPEPATWIKPFPVKIKYLEFTNDGRLRFPAFKGVV